MLLSEKYEYRECCSKRVERLAVEGKGLSERRVRGVRRGAKELQREAKGSKRAFLRKKGEREGNFRGGCKGVTKGGKRLKKGVFEKKRRARRGLRRLQKEAKGSLKTCPKPAPFPNNAESMPEKLHVFCYFPLYLYCYTCQIHARGSKIKKNMPQNFYTHLKSVIF